MQQRQDAVAPDEALGQRVSQGLRVHGHAGPAPLDQLPFQHVLAAVHLRRVNRVAALGSQRAYLDRVGGDAGASEDPLANEPEH